MASCCHDPSRSALGSNVSLLGGTFRSTSGELSIGSSWTDHNDGGLTVSGGSFVANGGTLVFDGDKGGALFTTVAVIDVDQRLVLDHLRVDLRDPVAEQGHNGAVLRIADGDTVEIKGDLVLRDGKIVGGQIELDGDVVRVRARLLHTLSTS